jgi:cell division protein ZapA
VDKSTVKVTIYGSEYLIKGDAQTEQIVKIAKYVDQKMQEINKSGAIKSPLKVAILASLNIADEYFKARDDQKSQIESYEAHIRKISDMVNSDNSAADSSAETTDENKETEPISLFSQP